MDTAVTGEGVNVLGETDTDYNVTEDSMAETAGPAASAGSSAEPSLEEIEDDVNLDSFGSGSGLLDLSLQADDTSLGGILDEIYTAEGGEGEATPAEGEAAPAEAAAGEAAPFDDITAEADHTPAEEEMAVPEPVAVMPAAMAPAFAEAVPDAQSNLLGMLLFLPLLALLYTTIVAVSGMRNVMPSILASVQSLIWYIVGWRCRVGRRRFRHLLHRRPGKSAEGRQTGQSRKGQEGKGRQGREAGQRSSRQARQGKEGLQPLRQEKGKGRQVALRDRVSAHERRTPRGHYPSWARVKKYLCEMRFHSSSKPISLVRPARYSLRACSAI